MASLDGQVVGWLATIRSDGRHEIDLTFGVNPSYSGIGIGSLLTDIALERAKEERGQRVTAPA